MTIDRGVSFVGHVKGVISWILEVRASGSTCVLPPCIGSALEFRSSEMKVRVERFWRDVGGGSEMIQRRQEILEEEIILIDIRTRELQTKYRCLNTETIGAQERRLVSEVQIGVM